MRVLLDTHMAFWAFFEPFRLKTTERQLLEHSDIQVVLSAVNIWELRLKWNKFHKSSDRKGPINPAQALQTFRELDIPILPLNPEAAAVTLTHPIDHKDPFDELLLIIAQEFDSKLLTRDRKLLGHPLAYSPL